MNYENVVHNLKAHDKEIYTIRWSPVGYTLARQFFLVTLDEFLQKIIVVI